MSANQTLNRGVQPGVCKDVVDIAEDPLLSESWDCLGLGTNLKRHQGVGLKVRLQGVLFLVAAIQKNDIGAAGCINTYRFCGCGSCLVCGLGLWASRHS